MTAQTTDDEFKTIAAEARAEIRVQGSRFIATAAPVFRTEDAEAFVARIRREFHDATHNCYGYRIGSAGTEFRFLDDGEPAGTAGRPILACIERHGLTNVVVVVSRYFGGTKLGTGGLARAYREAAGQALQVARRVTGYAVSVLAATFPHAYIGNVMHAVSGVGARIRDTAYDEEVHLTIEVRESRTEDLTNRLFDLTRGNVRVSSLQRTGADRQDTSSTKRS